MKNFILNLCTLGTKNFVVCTLFFFLLYGCGQEFSAPNTRSIIHYDEYHGQKINDPYRWLEKFTTDEVKEWVSLQNNFSSNFIDNQYQKNIQKDLESIWTSEYLSTPYKVQGKTFYYFNTGKLQQNIFMVKDCDACKERVLIDPNQFSIDGTVAIATTSVSPDGKWVAFAKSDGGSDWRTWKIMNIENGQMLADELRWSKFSGAEWSPDSKGFFYVKYPKPNDQELSDVNSTPAIMYHLLQTNQLQDDLIIEDKENPLLSWSISVSDDGQFKILYTTKGTDERNLISVGRYNEQFIPIIDEFKASFSFINSNNGDLFFLTNHKAPNGKVVRLDFNNLDAGFQDIIEESEMPIRSVDMINQNLIVQYLDNTFSNIKYFTLEGEENGSLETTLPGTISGLSGKNDDIEVFYSFTNFTQPSQIYKLDLSSNSQELYWEEKLENFKPENYLSNIMFYPSKDGTLIPLHVTHRKNQTITPDTPVLLYGYGGFSVSLLPRFSKRFLAWMNQGGVFALANLRGGSEYGKKWHEQGMLLNKQNVFDDFAYAAKFLHSKKIGSPKSTAIQGGSNGGLLVGAVMLQNPNLFGFAIPQVGVMDMLRFNKFTIGWGWESDYGSPEKLEDFLNLYSYSPYHNIKEGICYPPTLITTSERDDRVVPSHSYKFAARLQNLQGCKNPIMLRVESRAGHGSGKPRNKQISEIADTYGTALNFISKN
ncbi:MAG: prolyl oligopeptidase family serine peptidase [Proteobacteria bacterium]|nr:prolyl oligopeptidase family serine peptidase [Pseudomonadota bacterium]MDA0942495.1 prolyl oligopeptidase family serine peptidase [Pseudomonadota bacterium]